MLVAPCGTPNAKSEDGPMLKHTHATAMGTAHLAPPCPLLFRGARRGVKQSGRRPIGCVDRVALVLPWPSPPRSSAPRYGASGHMCGRRLGFRSIRKAQRVTRHKRNNVERGAVRGPLRVMDGGSGRTGSSGCIGGNASGDTGMRFGIHGLGVVELLEG